MAAPKKQFVFVHIPKTAGTTFVLSLARLFRWHKIASFYSPERRKKQLSFTAKYKSRFDLYYGHIPLIIDQNMKRDIEYFTFLREPRELLLSGYRYLKRDGNKNIKKKEVRTYHLKDFLKHGALKNFDNIMVRFLSGKVEKPYLEINEQDLEVAIKNLDSYFKVFGLTEYFDESLVLLSNHMNWPHLNYVKENRSDYKMDPGELDEEVEKGILLCTRYDRILYDHAKAKFLKLLKENQKVVDAGLIELREGNRKKKNILSIRNKASLLYAKLRIKLP